MGTVIGRKVMKHYILIHGMLVVHTGIVGILLLALTSVEGFAISSEYSCSM